LRRTLNQVHVHFVWATWDRLPLVTPEIEQHVYAAIRAKCDELGCPVVALGGVEDHVHLVVKLGATTSLSQLMRDVKGASSHLVTHEIAPDALFKWQGAYAAFAVETENLPRIVQYVQRQKEHHREGTDDPSLESVPERDDQNP
jgi:putative transposase